MSLKINDKIKEVLSPEDLSQLEEAIQALIDEKVLLKEEELKKHYEKLSEEYVVSETAKKVEEKENILKEEYATKVAELETHIVEKLDAFLESEIDDKISDEIIDKVAINEVAMPIVEQIKRVLEENAIEVNDEASSKITKLEEQLESLKTENSTLIEEKSELTTLCESSACKLLLRDKTEGLTDAQKEKVVTLFEDKSFEEIETKIDSYVEILIKEENKKSDEKVIEEGIDPKDGQGGDGLKEPEKKSAPTISQVASKWM